MSSLSTFTEDGIAIVCANPIFLTSEPEFREGSQMTFEVFAADATSLKSRVGKLERYYLDSHPPFWAELTRLEPCESTHPGLARLRDTPTLRGVFTMRHVVTVPHSAPM